MERDYYTMCCYGNRNTTLNLKLLNTGFLCRSYNILEALLSAAS